MSTVTDKYVEMIIEKWRERTIEHLAKVSVNTLMCTGDGEHMARMQAHPVQSTIAPSAVPAHQFQVGDNVFSKHSGNGPYKVIRIRCQMIQLDSEPNYTYAEDFTLRVQPITAPVAAPAPQPPQAPKTVIFSTHAHGKVGEIKPYENGMVGVYLDASYWPEVTRDGKNGEQFMGEFHGFESFKITGSFDDLMLISESSYFDGRVPRL